MGDVAVANKKTDLEIITESKITEYLNVMGLSGDLQLNEQKQFIEIATAFQLNPFKREIYCVAYNTKRGRKLSIITGYEVYLKRAERTEKLNGWKVEINGKRSDGSLKAVVTIHRKDWREPFVHEVFWIEYKQNNQMWDSKPVTMIKKVGMAQAFRMCFPDEFEGMPYTSDELPDEMTVQKNVSPLKPEKEEELSKAVPMESDQDQQIVDEILEETAQLINENKEVFASYEIVALRKEYEAVRSRDDAIKLKGKVLDQVIAKEAGREQKPEENNLFQDDLLPGEEMAIY